MTRELDFYNLFYQMNTRGDDTKTYQLFEVPIGSAKTTNEMIFYPESPILKEHQKEYNSCCLCSLA